MGKVVIVGLILSVLPIWRHAGVEKPLNVWELLAEMRTPMKHIAVGEARDSARQAGYL